MPPKATHASKHGLTIKAYPGDGSVLLAFNLDRKLVDDDFAGFAIKCTPPNGKSYYLPNRLNFLRKITADTAPQQRTWTPSDQAPFQKFYWVDFPPDVKEGKPYGYEVSAMYFDPGQALQARYTAGLTVTIAPADTPRFQLGFTRGYLTSQAYADKFQNHPIRPAEKTLDYDTKPYQAQYEWLGFDARKLVFQFLQDAVDDKSVHLDLFAYDLDEPDFIRGLQKLGPRLRAVLDNSPLHTKAGALEIQARALLEKSAGAENICVGHFHRYAHDKVMIQHKDGKAMKVLTGSANFSVRGLYVQANNVLVFNDANVAQCYEEAFQQAFTGMKNFPTSQIAAQWFEFPRESQVPAFSVSFAPHEHATVSLDKVEEAIHHAQSSVLFAVMELSGGGPVLETLRTIHDDKRIFSYGMTQSAQGMTVYKPDSGGILVPFAALDKNVPQPFRQEWRGGPGQVIHHKFVVVDFNDAHPVVFTGSSNLAEGGEQANGDNLLAITDRDVAQAFAIEAIRLVDHYHFRAVMQSATDDKPLILQAGGSARKWWEPYYDAQSIRSRERLLFAGEGAAEAMKAVA